MTPEAQLNCFGITDWLRHVDTVLKEDGRAALGMEAMSLLSDMQERLVYHDRISANGAELMRQHLNRVKHILDELRQED